MAFDGYSIDRRSIFTHDEDMSFQTRDVDHMLKIVDVLKKKSPVGTCILVFEEDTEYDGNLLLSWFYDAYKGWIKDYDKTDIELTKLESFGFFDN